MIRFSPLVHRFALGLALVAGVAVSAGSSARAAELADARATLAKAVSVVESVRQDKNFQDDFDPLLQRARAVLVVPSFYKGAFFIGGAYGNGVLTVRDDAGQFSPPAFMRMIGGSLGLQFGGQEGQLLFLIMTRQGLDAILEDKFKIGATAGVSVGTVGANIEAATTSNMDSDILVWGHSSGAFGGGAIEGAGIEPRPEWNRAVYGANATPKAILFDRRWTLDEAKPLIAALSGEPATPGTGPAAIPSEGSSGMSSTARPPAEPAYSASGQTTGQSVGGADTAAEPSAPSSSAAGSSSSKPVRLMPVERQTLE